MGEEMQLLKSVKVVLLLIDPLKFYLTSRITVTFDYHVVRYISFLMSYSTRIYIVCICIHV